VTLLPGEVSHQVAASVSLMGAANKEHLASMGPQALSSLLTVEGLLLASLAVMASLSSPTRTGRPLPTRAHTAAVVVSLAITLVAMGAAVLVRRLYIDMPHGADPWVAGPLLVGVIVQPLFAWWITKGLRGS
jgi:hypothetical protein